MEKRGGGKQQTESATDLFLRWGNKKRLRCVRVRDSDDTTDPSFAVSGRRRIRRKINSHFVAFSSDNDSRDPSSIQPPSTRLTRNSEAATSLSNRKSSPEKEDKLYTTRGCATAGVVEKPKISSAVDGGGGVDESSSSKSKHVWPKLYIALTSKEKEEDFMAMKGCKLPHRPKKRAKTIQRTLLVNNLKSLSPIFVSSSIIENKVQLLTQKVQLVSPGAWLTDMCQERYEVRENKSTKKRPTGLKAMGSMESDSE